MMGWLLGLMYSEREILEVTLRTLELVAFPVTAGLSPAQVSLA